MNAFRSLLMGRTRALVMPIAVHPGIELTGATVRDVVTSADAQVAAVEALRGRLRTEVILSAMDLSVEAEAFGCAIHMADHEVPTVMGARVTGESDLGGLPDPLPGTGRTRVYLDTVRRLRTAHPEGVVVGGCIGPFSLASRLAGMTEMLGLTITDPGFAHAVLARAAAFLAAYVRAFREAGADAVIMAEPGAGLLSPKAMAEFSSAYIRQIRLAACGDGCELILHNCAARLVHLPAMLETGVQILHFGAPMDMVGALSRVPEGVVVCGNLDPTEVLLQGTPASVSEQAGVLLAAAGDRKFVLSSGCDVPPGTPVANLEAMMNAVRVDRGGA